MSDSNPIVLRSTANPTVRHLVRMRDNRARRRAGRVIVDGWRETARAIEAGLQLCGVYLTESSPSCDSDDSGDRASVIDAATRLQKRQIVSAGVMEKISYGQSARGVVAEFVQPRRSLADLALPESPLLLVLDQIEKPGNVGAVFRCADAAGVDAVVLCDGRCDLFNPNAIRSSLGAVFHVPAAEADLQQTTEFLANSALRVLAGRVECSQSLWETDLQGPLAMVLGSEAEGLGDRWLRLGNQAIESVRIPMVGKVDSLNLSVSAAVIAFEAARVRQAGS